MHFAFYKSKIGLLRIGYCNDHICSISIANEIINDEKDKISDLAFKEIAEYLEGNRIEFTFPYKLNGTIFQNNVWDELCKIPYSEIRTYKDIAINIGNPKAFRAVGNANNKNPMMIVVPCHRVIGSNNKLVGYAGGLEVKKKLLDLEKNTIIKQFER